MKEPQKILEELIGSKPEKLTGEAKRLFEAIMKIADERDELLKEKQADKEKIKELESDKEIKDKMMELMAEQLTTPIHSKKDVVEYFENLAKESGEIDDI